MDKKKIVMIVSIIFILTVTTLRIAQINNNHLANEQKLDECMANGDSVTVFGGSLFKLSTVQCD